MPDENIQVESAQLESAIVIICIMPDDGTDIKLMRRLKNEKAVTRVESIACRGVNNLQNAKTRLGKLPEPALYRYLSAIVTEAQADDVFNFIYHTAQIGKPNRGFLIKTTLLGATTYSMPDNVADEENMF